MLRMTGRLRARTATANGLQFGVLEAGSGPLALYGLGERCLQKEQVEEPLQLIVVSGDLGLER